MSFTLDAAKEARKLRESTAQHVRWNALELIGDLLVRQKIALARVRLCNGQLDNEKSLDGAVRRIQWLYRTDRL